MKFLGTDNMLALPEDFRTLDWTEIIEYPELAYQQTQ